MRGDRRKQWQDAPVDGEPVGALDPDDWEAFRATAHRALDGMLDDLGGVAAGPVWRPMPDRVRNGFHEAAPRAGARLEDVLGEFWSTIAPYATGNRHPLFMGWVHGAGTPVGMLAEMLAAGLNANCGGRDHVGIEVERQITRWSAELLGFPADASGVFVTGTSMANFLGLLIARTERLGVAVRRSGLDAEATLTAYAADGAHGCIAQALELAGIGSRQLRVIPVDAAGAMRPDALARAIASDRGEGCTPFLIVGTAGSVNRGSIDPLDALADIAAREGLWFHIDGAFGAMAALSQTIRPRLAGLERADSVAFDFHKWAHVPYDCGFLLVRDAAAHKRAFASPDAYLQRAARGLAAGTTWPCDLGPDLSRGFRALKTWFTLKTLGADRIAAAIDSCCAAARHLEARLRDSGRFEIVSPAQLNIVCWRVAGPVDDGVNEDIVMDLHERGIAAPSMTTLAARPVMRAAIVNHRTTLTHIDAFVDALVAIASERAAPTRQHLDIAV